MEHRKETKTVEAPQKPESKKRGVERNTKAQLKARIKKTSEGKVTAKPEITNARTRSTKSQLKEKLGRTKVNGKRNTREVRADKTSQTWEMKKICLGSDTMEIETKADRRRAAKYALGQIRDLPTDNRNALEKANDELMRQERLSTHPLAKTGGTDVETLKKAEHIEIKLNPKGYINRNIDHWPFDRATQYELKNSLDSQKTKTKPRIQ